ncbi:smp-30 gluconolaconase lre-like region containing protein [Apiospora hydei]|uniref:Smp-30 gluconolaconase lre-like region containing protein n=1 Tax=Apiospora hydei TaxID=1337664 RepID=A0ABR1W7W3_9PEZI
MAAVIQSDIESTPADFEIVDLRNKQPSTAIDSDSIAIKQYHAGLESIFGRDGAECSLLLTSSTTSRSPFFHNACVYLPEYEELWVTSDLLQTTSSSQLPIVLISKIRMQRAEDDGDVVAVEWSKLRPPPDLPMPAGACAYRQGLLYCSQGTLKPETGGLYYNKQAILLTLMEVPRNKAPQAVVTSFGSRPLNSPQQANVSRDGAIWFTDPPLGFAKEIRPSPQLPSHVYRYDPELAGGLRVVADGFGAPTGLCFSPDEDTLYITDAGAPRDSGDLSSIQPATIYVFDILSRGRQPFLANKRVFAFAMEGAPVAVQCDDVGNVYAACGDGIEIWSPGGVPLGLIEVAGGCSNFCFGKQGEMFICAEQRLFRLQVRAGSSAVDILQ